MFGWSKEGAPVDNFGAYRYWIAATVSAAIWMPLLVMWARDLDVALKLLAAAFATVHIVVKLLPDNPWNEPNKENRALNRREPLYPEGRNLGLANGVTRPSCEHISSGWSPPAGCCRGLLVIVGLVAIGAVGLAVLIDFISYKRNVRDGTHNLDKPEPNRF